jgi:hypothetical protein
MRADVFNHLDEERAGVGIAEGVAGDANHNVRARGVVPRGVQTMVAAVTIGVGVT